MDVNRIITEHLDIWSAATERKSGAGRGNGGVVSLHGIKKLRALILELAIRGKLVEQDEKEGNGAELLAKCARAKNSSIKEKAFKKQNVGSKLNSNDVLFEVPNNWCWARLGDIGFIYNGNSVSSRDKSEKYGNANGLPFIATRNVGYGFEPINYNVDTWIPEGEPKFKIAGPNTPLICSEGGSAGRKCGLTDQAVCFGNKLFACQFYDEFHASFLLTIYQSPSFFAEFSRHMTGIIGGISLAKFLRLAVPIPPIAEQIRIVAKVNQLMRLCDALEAQTEDGLKEHQALVETCLATLTKSQNSQDLTQNWARIEAHFDVLFTTEESIASLEAAIIELGVTGLLVPQRKTDEPAALLLKRVAQDIETYSKLNRVKPVKSALIAEHESQGTHVPSGWVQTRLSSLFRVITDGDHQAPPRSSDGIAFLTIGNISSGKLDFDGCRRVPEDYYVGLPTYRTP